ncbi:MAG: hypothetical protein ACTH52_08990 [Lactococcus cremoris]|uniref:hypothetical protein n=1 Tax=Psychrobacter sp. AOP7-B1-24 TaxID=3457645 RepID=UPI003FB64DDD
MNRKLFLSILSIGFLTTTFSHANEGVTANIDAPSSVASKLSDINRNDLAIASPLGITVGKDSIGVALQKYPDLELLSSNYSNSDEFNYSPLGYRKYAVELDPEKNADIEHLAFLVDSNDIIHEIGISFDSKSVSYDDLYADLGSKYVQHPISVDYLNNSYAFSSADDSEWWGYYINKNTQFIAKNAHIDVAFMLDGTTQDAFGDTVSSRDLNGDLKAQLDVKPSWIKESPTKWLGVTYLSPSMVSMRHQKDFFVEKIFKNVYQADKDLNRLYKMTDALNLMVGAIENRAQLERLPIDYMFVDHYPYYVILSDFVDEMPTPTSDEEAINLYKAIAARTEKDLTLINIFEKYGTQAYDITQSDVKNKDQKIQEIAHQLEAELQSFDYS